MNHGGVFPDRNLGRVAMGDVGWFGFQRNQGFGGRNHLLGFGRFDHDRNFGFFIGNGEFDNFFGACCDDGFNTFNCTDFSPFFGRGFFQFGEPSAVIVSPFALPGVVTIGPSWIGTDLCWWREHAVLDAGVTIILQF
jgi:hypothetical protein